MKRILIIEDDLGIAELERDYLEANGFAVAIETDGAAGEKKALNEAYDLILLDIMLPGRDGFQLCRTIREKYKDQAVGHLTLTLTDSGEGSYLLSFADDGCGVDDSELPKLFESFYRTDKARTNVAKGSGLGLAVVQQIVQAMKGQIWAQATVPKGLTICITLPKGESINETHLDY